MTLVSLAWILSGILIGVGMHMLWRDTSTNRPNLLQRRGDVPPPIESLADVTITHQPLLAAGAVAPAASSATSITARATPPPAARSTPAPVAAGPQRTPPPPFAASPTSALNILGSTIDRILAENTDEQRTLDRSPHAQTIWPSLDPRIQNAIVVLLPLLTRAGVGLGAVGDPGWSPKSRGFGTYRRIMIAGESLAWLRTEALDAERLRIAVRAHRGEQALLNTGVELPITGLTPNHLVEALATTLKPAAEYAAWRAATARLEAETRRQKDGEFQQLIVAAVEAANGALAHAGAGLEGAPVSATANGFSGTASQRVAYDVMVGGKPVARMHIDQPGDGIEVAVGVPDASLMDLARARWIAGRDVTLPVLAEALASCAWPSIARAKGNV
jgi:hypothetical protein